MTASCEFELEENMQLCSPSSGGCVSHLAACSESLTVCLATCSSGPEQSLVGGGGVSQPVGGAEAESLRETESNLQSPASIGRYPMEWLLAIAESRRSANMKRCYVCGTWTRNPIRSPTHKDCPHSACCLKCLFPMERAYVALKHEMQEMDKSLEVQSTRRPPRADASQVPHSLDAPEPRLCNELCVADNLIAVYGSDAAHADKIDSKIKAEDHKKDDKKEDDKKRLSNEALDMDIPARKKSFREKKLASFENDVDSDEEMQGADKSRIYSEVLGGDVIDTHTRPHGGGCGGSQPAAGVEVSDVKCPTACSSGDDSLVGITRQDLSQIGNVSG